MKLLVKHFRLFAERHEYRCPRDSFIRMPRVSILRRCRSSALGFPVLQAKHFCHTVMIFHSQQYCSPRRSFFSRRMQYRRFIFSAAGFLRSTNDRHDRNLASQDFVCLLFIQSQQRIPHINVQNWYWRSEMFRDAVPRSFGGRLGYSGGIKNECWLT